MEIKLPHAYFSERTIYFLEKIDSWFNWIGCIPFASRISGIVRVAFGLLEMGYALLCMGLDEAEKTRSLEQIRWIFMYPNYFFNQINLLSVKDSNKLNTAQEKEFLRAFEHFLLVQGTGNILRGVAECYPFQSPLLWIAQKAGLIFGCFFPIFPVKQNDS